MYKKRILFNAFIALSLASQTFIYGSSEDTEDKYYLFLSVPTKGTPGALKNNSQDDKKGLFSFYLVPHDIDKNELFSDIKTDSQFIYLIYIDKKNDKEDKTSNAQNIFKFFNLDDGEKEKGIVLYQYGQNGTSEFTEHTAYLYTKQEIYDHLGGEYHEKEVWDVYFLKKDGDIDETNELKNHITFLPPEEDPGKDDNEKPEPIQKPLQEEPKPDIDTIPDSLWEKNKRKVPYVVGIGVVSLILFLLVKNVRKVTKEEKVRVKVLR